MVREILLLGNPKLYEVSGAVEKEELETLKDTIEDLHDTLIDYRQRMGAGRAIAAPQIGVNKRMIYLNISEPILFINPVLSFYDEEKVEILDDCMSFPYLYVKVMRYKRCEIEYFDRDWKKCQMNLEGDLAELIQHEFDHLDGILATMRATTNKSLIMKKI